MFPSVRRVRGSARIPLRGERPAPQPQLDVSTTGARSLSGSHQARFASYQRTVSASPSAKGDLVAPAELFAQLRRVEQVAAIVARPVGDDRLQRLRLVRQLEHGVGDLVDRLLDARADVVRLADSPVCEHELDRTAVVEHVQPLAPVLRRGVERQRVVVERVRDEERDHLLGELERAVVVRAVADRRRQAVRLEVRAHEVVGRRLRGVVRRARAVRRLLAEGLVGLERQIAVHLAGRDVMEALDAVASRGLEQHLRPDGVRSREQSGVEHREAVVRLRREVDDDLDLVLRQRARRRLGIGDVAVHERDVVRHVLAHARVREQVVGDDVIRRVALAPVADEVRADEAGGAGDEDAHCARV